MIDTGTARVHPLPLVPEPEAPWRIVPGVFARYPCPGHVLEKMGACPWSSGAASYAHDRIGGRILPITDRWYCLQLSRHELIAPFDLDPSQLGQDHQEEDPQLVGGEEEVVDGLCRSK